MKDAVKKQFGEDGIGDVLNLYCVMMSSDVFFSIAREYSTNSAGGQINLQQNLIAGIPMPNLAVVLATRPEVADMIAPWDGRFPPLEMRNSFASACYGFGVEGLV